MTYTGINVRACVNGLRFPQRSYFSTTIMRCTHVSSDSRFTMRKESVSQSLNPKCLKYQYASAGITTKRLAPVFVATHWPNPPTIWKCSQKQTSLCCASLRMNDALLKRYMMGGGRSLLLCVTTDLIFYSRGSSTYISNMSEIESRFVKRGVW